VDEAQLREYIRTHGDSPITIYVQHPIPIPAPGERGVGLKPLMLTSKVGFFVLRLRLGCFGSEQNGWTLTMLTGTKEDEKVEEEGEVAGSEG
jgi:hypothetical protein